MDRKIEIKEIELSKIKPNNWNPNVMNEKTYMHLKKEYERVGYLQPILVRQIDSDTYQIIDGEHRWRAANDFGLKTIKCVVVDMDEQTAKLTTINMNRIKGMEDSYKLSELIVDLNKSIDIETLSDIIAIPTIELQLLMNLTQANEFRFIEDNEPTDKKDKYIICPNCDEKIYLKNVKIKEEDMNE